MFINPLTIDLHIDLHMLQIKWIETETKIETEHIWWTEVAEPH